MATSTLKLQADFSGTAFGSSPTWTDITSYVMTSPQNSTLRRYKTRGGGRTGFRLSPLTCSFTLRNIDGRFTPGRSGLVNNLCPPDVASPGCVTGGTTSWPTLSGGTTVTYDNTQQLPVGPPTSLKVTVPTSFANGTATVQSLMIPVSASTVYSFAAQIEAVSVGWCVNAAWYTSASVLISLAGRGSVVAAGTTGYSTKAMSRPRRTPPLCR